MTAVKQRKLSLWGVLFLCSSVLLFSGCGKDDNTQQPNNNQTQQENGENLPPENSNSWSDMTGWEGSYTLEQARGYATELPVSAEERRKWMEYYAEKMNLSLLPVFTEGQKIDEQLLLNSGIIFAPWIEVPAEQITDEMYYNYYLEKDALESGILRHMGQAVEKPQSTDFLIYDEAAQRYYLEVFGIEGSYYLRLEKLLQTNDGDFIGCFDAYSSISIMDLIDFQDESEIIDFFNAESTEGLPEVAEKVVIKWRPLDNGQGTDILYLAHEMLEVE